MLAVGLAIWLALYPDAEINAFGRLVRLTGAVGGGLMISAMAFGAAQLVAWAAAVLVIQYGVSLSALSEIDPWAPLYAALLLLSVEAAYASLERRARIAGLSGRLTKEVGRLVGLGLAAFGLAALVLVMASAPVAYGIFVQVAGVGAAAAVLTTLVLLVRQRT